MSDTSDAKIVDTEYKTIESGATVPQIEGFSEKEAGEIKELLKQFLDSYAKKEQELSDEAWLRQELHKTLPEETEETVRSLSQEIVQSVAEWNDNVKSLHNPNIYIIFAAKLKYEYNNNKLNDNEKDYELGARRHPCLRRNGLHLLL